MFKEIALTLLVSLTSCMSQSKLDLNAVTAPVADPARSFDEMREAWSWLVAPDDRAVLITAIGDVFLRSPDGHFKFLDTQYGRVYEIGALPADWREALSNHPRREEWFHPAFVVQLRAAHGLLKPEMCYSATVPRSLSGKETTENYTPRLAEMHLWYDGQLQRQVKDLPPGTVITKITTPKL
jgi:hypothetical protein